MFANINKYLANIKKFPKHSEPDCKKMNTSSGYQSPNSNMPPAMQAVQQVSIPEMLESEFECFQSFDWKWKQMWTKFDFFF